MNLGCGLDDRRRRIDNGLVRWFDLDLPEVIKLRRRFLPETERMRFIASSVLDLTWLDQLPDEAGARCLFLAEGLFMYLPPDGVRTLVTTLAKRRPGAELVAEVANSRIVRTMQGRFGRGKFRREFGLSADVVYQFGLANSREIEEWAPELDLPGRLDVLRRRRSQVGHGSLVRRMVLGPLGAMDGTLSPWHECWGRTGDQPAGGLTNRSI